MEGALGSGGAEVLEKEEASLSDSSVLISLGSPAEPVVPSSSAHNKQQLPRAVSPKHLVLDGFMEWCAAGISPSCKRRSGHFAVNSGKVISLWIASPRTPGRI